MRIRLIRKFANVINGIDLTRFHVGDCLDVTPSQASLLIAEGWAEQIGAVAASNLEFAADAQGNADGPTESGA